MAAPRTRLAKMACAVAAATLRTRIPDATAMPDAAEMLNEALTYVSGAWRRHLEVLARERDQKVAEQNFDAAAVLRDEIRDLTRYWSAEEFTKRVRAVLGMTP